MRVAMKERPFSVVLVSPNAVLSEGLVRILGRSGCNTVCCRYFVDDSIIVSLPTESVVLAVVDASDDFDAAINQIEPFKLRYPSGRVTVLVSQHQVQLPQMLAAFRRGASAYLTNCMAPEALIKSIELVMLGEAILPVTMLTELLSHQHGHPGRWGNQLPHLSARETDIVHCLVQGNSNKVIARKMKIADATVKVHVKAILRKIRVANRTQVAIWAMRNGPLTSANGLFDDKKPQMQPASSMEIIEPLSWRVLSERKNAPTRSSAVETGAAHPVAAPSFEDICWKG
jgi:two-component system nitrate/nitrite response regulator NarL